MLHYHVEKIMPLDPNISQVHPAYNFISYFVTPVFYLIHPFILYLTCDLCSLGFQTKIVYKFLISLKHATCPNLDAFLNLLPLCTYYESPPVASSL